MHLKVKSQKMYKGSNFQFNLERFHATVQRPGYLSSGTLHKFMVINVQVGSCGEKAW